MRARVVVAARRGLVGEAAPAIGFGEVARVAVDLDSLAGDLGQEPLVVCTGGADRGLDERRLGGDLVADAALRHGGLKERLGGEHVGVGGAGRFGRRFGIAERATAIAGQLLGARPRPQAARRLQARLRGGGRRSRPLQRARIGADRDRRELARSLHGVIGEVLPSR